MSLNRRNFVRCAAAGLGAMAVVSREVVPSAQEPTMSLNVLYPNHEGARFDIAYYRSTHIPLAMKIMKASSVMLIEGVSNGAPAPYAMIAHFQFPSADALKAALADPGMADVRADVPRFTDIRPTVMVGRSV
ncbi:MAG TPA: EthD family reductase [Vicinamibacterales bacterium]